MTMVKKSELATIDFNNEATKSVFCGMLEGLKHPYILPVLEVRFCALPSDALWVWVSRLVRSWTFDATRAARGGGECVGDAGCTWLAAGV
jgi:hypothetical protein